CASDAKCSPTEIRRRLSGSERRCVRLGARPFVVTHLQMRSSSFHPILSTPRSRLRGDPGLRLGPLTGDRTVACR
ncbi:MAG TPA: hypothetical protein VKK19_01795, partial [Candidatus Dormibacteraeota bacterium]|nr:hypothetical protein [Candidatus Dormibacteraeota bacterium]